MQGIRPLILWLGILTLSSHYAVGNTPCATRDCDSKKTSVLWVIDNLYLSESQDQQKFKSDLIDLAQRLDDASVNYKMAVTTTDTFTDQGQLRKSGSGVSIVASHDPDHLKNFGDILDTISNSATDFWPQGLAATTMAIQSSQGLIDDGTPLNVIYVTGEDDYSCAAECYGVEPWDNKNWVRNPPQNFANQFKALKQMKNISVVLYPIIGLGNDSCAVNHVGTNYESTRALMGSGMSNSVCLNDLPVSIRNVATQIIQDVAKH